MRNIKRNNKKDIKRFNKLKWGFGTDDYVLLGNVKNWKLVSVDSDISNEAVLSSEESTLDDLYEFGKKTIEIRLGKAIALCNLIIMAILMILLVLNIFIFKNDLLRVGVLSAELVVIIIDMVIFYVDNYNWKIMEQKMEITRKRFREKVGNFLDE